MKKEVSFGTLIRPALAILVALGALAGTADAQDRLVSMPGYDQYQRVGREVAGAVRSGALSVTWHGGGQAFEYQLDGKVYRYDLATRQATEIASSAEVEPQRFGRRGGPERGRQFEEAVSPNGKLRAFYRDRNLWLSDIDGGNEIAVTTDGSVEMRVKNGTASWVYGEELGQSSAMWWSPSGKKLAYYRFDESGVPDYFLQLDQTQIQSTMDIEAYPKAGVPNPVVELFVYDLETGRTVGIDVRSGRPFTNDVIGHYVYRIGWSPDGSEITFNRTNRRQNTLEFTACSPESGECRVVLREEWPESWVENSPTLHYLEDGKRFIWASERTG
jgi:dipeptidyl-peptidase-4